MREEEKKKKIRRELKKIYDVLKNHPIEITIQWYLKERNVRGTIVNENKILIDPFKEIIEVLVHEIYHLILPNAPHQRIYGNSEFIIRHASPSQLKRLFGYFWIRWINTILKKAREKKRTPRCPFCNSIIRKKTLEDVVDVV